MNDDGIFSAHAEASSLRYRSDAANRGGITAFESWSLASRHEWSGDK
jgi:hypothetical protein